MKADLLDRLAKTAMEQVTNSEIQTLLLECYNALAKPIMVDVVIAEALQAEKFDVAGVFTSTDRANTIVDQINRDTDCPFLAGVIRMGLDIPRSL